MAKQGITVGAGVGFADGRHEKIAKNRAVEGIALFLEIIQSAKRRKALGLIGELKLLGCLLLIVKVENTEGIDRRPVQVQFRAVAEFAPGTDGPKVPGVTDLPADIQVVTQGFGARRGVEIRVDPEGIAVCRERPDRDSGRVGIDERDVNRSLLGRRARPVGVAIRVVEGQLHIDAVRGVKGEYAAEKLRIAVAIVAAVEGIARIPFPSELGKGQSPQQSIAHQRAADREPGIELIVLAHRHRSVPGKCFGGRRRHVFDGAAHRVSTVERTLRAAQHLDTFDIDHIQEGALRPA